MELCTCCTQALTSTGSPGEGGGAASQQETALVGAVPFTVHPAPTPERTWLPAGTCALLCPLMAVQVRVGMAGAAEALFLPHGAGLRAGQGSTPALKTNRAELPVPITGGGAQPPAATVKTGAPPVLATWAGAAAGAVGG